MGAAAQIDRDTARAYCWHVGALSFLRTRTQRQAHRHWAQRARGTVRVLRCTRRFGKTYDLVITAWEQAISAPGSVIRYIAPTKLAGRQFVIPAFEWVARQAPEYLRPKYNFQDGCWKWPNGSVCHLGSAETMNDIERQVGTECHLALVDECGKYQNGLLTHLIRSVLRPQFLTTGGHILLASTPPISGAHDFTAWTIDAAERGALLTYTIDDVDHITPEAKAEAIEELGGADNPEVRRELYCEDVIDETRAIVPEFARVKDSIVVERQRPEHFDLYVSADFGFHDLTVVLFAYWDFQRAKVVIEDEIAMHYASGLEVGRAVVAKERALLQHGTVGTVTRVADAPAQLLADLAHPTLGCSLPFGPAVKDDADAALNFLRTELGRGRIEIHPRCEVLRAHLQFGVWNLNRTSFERAEKYGHWDAIDALKYLLRSVARLRNPEPIVPARVLAGPHHMPPHLERAANNQEAERLARAFGRRL